MISIIIPTYNRAKNLKENLYRLISYISNPGEIEIIIIDNGSSDNTFEVVEKIIKFHSENIIKYIFDSEPGLLTGRHRGYNESSGSILAFIDDDILVSETWLIFLQNLKDHYLDFGFFTGPNLPFYNCYPPDWLKYFWKKNNHGIECSWLSLLDFGTISKEIPLNYIFGLNFIVRRDVFKAVGGFNPDNISPEFQQFQGDGETGLTIRASLLGFKAFYDARLLVMHQITCERLTKNYFGKRAYYQGVCDSFTSLKRQYKFENKISYFNSNSTNNLRNEKLKSWLFDKFLFTFIIDILKKYSILKEVVIYLMYLHILNYTKKQYDSGFRFHQNAFYTNSLVRKWVLLDNYWEYKLPVKEKD